MVSSLLRDDNAICPGIMSPMAPSLDMNEGPGDTRIGVYRDDSLKFADKSDDKDGRDMGNLYDDSWDSE